jgi:hypothetical protein
MRAFSSGANVLADAATNNYSFALTSVNDANMYLNFLSIPSSLKLPPKFIVPYVQYTRYKTSFTGVNVGSQLKTTNNIQLQSVPQSILVYVQKNESTRTIQSPDTFYSIERISVNFANRSGLLTSAEQYQLYKMSRDNGIQLDWYSWSGLAKKFIAAADDAVGGRGVDVKTQGSILIINPAKDLSLDEVITNGSGGAFNLQMDITFQNSTAVAAVDLCVLICENGYLKNINGSTTSSLAPLSADQVVETLSSGNAISDHNELSKEMNILGGMAPYHMQKTKNIYPRGGARSGGNKMQNLLM